ncbi:hypothetical protein FGO68_gene5134 [Halteria grandinella]|uniref:Uncharacterized protein n=1 Tax=Halteria grandinella TaxID=5974 RepID=A0A8J8P4P8_HALGN|nr:hypothetical protein FGO68_gene5134 [Halteria grandinella]
MNVQLGFNEPRIANDRQAPMLCFTNWHHEILLGEQITPSCPLYKYQGQSQVLPFSPLSSYLQYPFSCQNEIYLH